MAEIPEEVVEAVEQAIYKRGDIHPDGCDMRLVTTADAERVAAAAYPAHGFAALATLDQEGPCETCGDSREIEDVHGRSNAPCPACPDLPPVNGLTQNTNGAALSGHPATKRPETLFRAFLDEKIAHLRGIRRTPEGNYALSAYRNAREEFGRLFSTICLDCLDQEDEAPVAAGWRVGQLLRHPNGTEWELIEHIGGEQDDWRIRKLAETLEEREGQVTVTFTRDEADKLKGFGRPIDGETPCSCGAIQPAHGCAVSDSAHRKVRAALDSTTHDPEED